MTHRASILTPAECAVYIQACCCDTGRHTASSHTYTDRLYKCEAGILTHKVGVGLLAMNFEGLLIICVCSVFCRVKQAQQLVLGTIPALLFNCHMAISYVSLTAGFLPALWQTPVHLLQRCCMCLKNLQSECRQRDIIDRHNQATKVSWRFLAKLCAKSKCLQPYCA